MTTDDLTTFQRSLLWIWHGHHTYSWWNREFYSNFICSTLSLVTWLLHVFLIFELYCTSEMKELIYEMNIIRVTMDEAKEVHTCLRAAGGMFKFVKVFRLNMIHFGYPFLSQTTGGMKLGYFWLILLSAGKSDATPWWLISWERCWYWSASVGGLSDAVCRWSTRR